MCLVIRVQDGGLVDPGTYFLFYASEHTVWSHIKIYAHWAHNIEMMSQ